VNFDIQVVGMAELRQRIEAMKARAADLKPGLLRAGMVVLRAAKDHIKSGAGDEGPWPPNITGTPLLFRSGRLINSLTIGSPDGVLDMQDGSVTVGTNVPYARWNQEGTGIYGPTGQRIFPKTAKALAWDGHVVRSIKGTPKRRYLYIDDAQAVRIRAVFADYILKGLPATPNDS
jgi:phage gpG-like protein